MKQWTVNYRGNGGKQTSLVIEAEDRKGVLAELKKRGISATSIHEGVAKKSSSASPMRGLVAGALVVVIAVVAMYFIFKNNAKPEAPKESKKARAITELPTPAPRPKPAPVVAEVKPEKPKELPPQKVGETRDGYIKLPSGRLHKVKGVITNTTAAVKGKYEIFDHHSENEIACLLTIQPGEGLVGTPRYNGRFTKDFLESLKTPIIVTADDSPEDAELKRNMIQAKIELKAAYDRGEDIEQIMLDTRKEYQKLSIFKMDMRQAINEYKQQEGVTDDDVEIYVQAANKLLEEKGIAPLKMGPITMQKIRMMKLQEREAAGQ